MSGEARERSGEEASLLLARLSARISQLHGIYYIKFNQFFIFIFKEPLSKSALYHAFNVCEVSRHILFNTEN